MEINDSLTNVLSGMGTVKDKSTFVSFVFSPLPADQLSAAYRGDWIAAKAVDIPAKDATREWRAWQADKKDITLLEKEEKRLNVQKCVLMALIKSRLYGGAAIVIGISGDDPTKELNPENVKKGGIAYLHAVSRHEITAGPISKDLLSPYYDQPSYYEVNSDVSGLVRIHPSRVARFLGREIPDRNQAVNGWGDSVLDALKDAVKNAGVSQAEVATMMQEACVDVIRIPNFMQNVGTAAYSSKILQRFSLAATGKSINRALMLDKDEEWSKISQNFSNLPELMRLYLGITAAAANIPAIKFLGESPGGLNATGASDIRNYYDDVASKQKNDISPAISPLDECLIRSALGSRPEEIFYIWKPLWQMTETEKADNMLKKSQAISNYVNTGLVPNEVLATAAQNMLIEDGCLPGLENAMDEYAELAAAEVDEPIDENDPEVVAQFEKTNADPVAAQEDDPITDAEITGIKKLLNMYRDWAGK
jgi:phage-related protein (TIGR01555 family)